MTKCKCFAEFVISLEASDDFLKKRVQEFPESVAEKMGFTEEEFVARLKRYRLRSSADNPLLDYFDELEIYPELIGAYSGTELVLKYPDLLVC